MVYNLLTPGLEKINLVVGSVVLGTGAVLLKQPHSDIVAPEHSGWHATLAIGRAQEVGLELLLELGGYGLANGDNGGLGHGV